MRLLLITQTIDEDDGVLGFMHGWISTFVSTYDSIVAVCLQQGTIHLPKNVQVVSLGKESHASRISMLVRFFRAVWLTRNKCDAVFVHMNVEYVLLAGWFWKLRGKKVSLWYNHKQGGLKLWLARPFLDTIFYTSSQAYTVRFSNAVRMPVGIDTRVFKCCTKLQAQKKSIVYIGRIAPVKHLEIFINAVKELVNRGAAISAHIYGDALERDKKYYEELRQSSVELESRGAITFHSQVPNIKSPAVYNSHDIVVNMTPDGSFDKVIIEGMACERLVLVSNTVLKDVLPAECIFLQNDANDMANKLQKLLELPSEQAAVLGAEFRSYVVEHESLDALIKKIHRYI